MVWVRYYVMLHVQVPRCWKVCNDFYGGGGTAFLNGRIRRAVIFKPDANELRTRVQLNRGLAQLRVYRAGHALKRQKDLRMVLNGVRALTMSEGRLRRSISAAAQSPRARVL